MNNYANIKDGQIVLTVDPTFPNAVKRIKTNGKETWEVTEKKIVGMIKSVSVFDTNFGRRIQLEIEGKNGDTTLLQLKANTTKGGISSHAKSFYKQIFNVDIKQPVRITTYDFLPEGQEIRSVGLTIEQAKSENGKAAAYKVEKKFPQIPSLKEDGNLPPLSVNISGKWVTDTMKSITIQSELEKALDDFSIKSFGKPAILTANPNVREDNDFDSFMAQPLTEDEKKQLKKPTTKKTEKWERHWFEADEESEEDLFNSIN